MFDTKPGDMFILRNVETLFLHITNNDYHGSSAVIEYAVNILGVNTLLFVSSHCGACKSLYQDLGNNSNLINVKKWLDLGKRAKEYAILSKINQILKKNI